MTSLSDDALNGPGPEITPLQVPSAESSSSSSSKAQPLSTISSWQKRRKIQGVETEVLIQTFDDRTLVIVTQNDKMGSLDKYNPSIQVQASLPPVTPLPHPPPPTSSGKLVLPPPPDSISLLPLVGSPPNPDLHSLYVSQLATLVWWTLQDRGRERAPVVVALTLGKGQPGLNSLPDGEEDGAEDHEGERERFMGVMSLIAEWPGPS